MGISPKLVAGVWVGGEYRCIHFSNGTYGQGSRTALPIFGRFMEYVLKDPKLSRIYKGRFDAPDAKRITKEYVCAPKEEESKPVENVKNFFKKIFGRDKSDAYRDSVKQEKKKARQERKEKRRERRRNRR